MVLVTELSVAETLFPVVNILIARPLNRHVFVAYSGILGISCSAADS